jgi:hypothetical protein
MAVLFRVGLSAIKNGNGNPTPLSLGFPSQPKPFPRQQRSLKGNEASASPEGRIMITGPPAGCFSRLPDSSSPLEAVAALRRMRGGSQSVLMRASDGALYVVKMMGNPQGPNVLANEVLGNELASHLGLCVPVWRPIRLSDEFLDRNRLCWFESISGIMRPPAGVHFALLALGQNSMTRSEEVLPGSWISRLGNRTDFVAMLVLDLWANHMDNRQAIFVRSGDTESITAVFVDNGDMFGGPFGQLQHRPGTTLYLDRRVYGVPSLGKVCSQWLRRIRSINEGEVLRLVRLIPDEWAGKEYRTQVTSQLRTRRTALSHLLEKEMSLIEEMGVGSPPIRENESGRYGPKTARPFNFGRTKVELSWNCDPPEIETA